MAMIKGKQNFRVIVEPKSWLPSLEDDKSWQRMCEDIITDINRHVEGVAWAGVEYDDMYTCDNCGNSYDEITDNCQWCKTPTAAPDESEAE